MSARSLILVAALVVLDAAPAWSGMPSPLPSDPELVWRLGDSATMRLQTISFFLVGFFVAAGVVQLLWNVLRRDIPAMPRLSYGRAVAGVLLWGLLFVIVLTMISGARELMTPGAWKKQGFTFKLDEPKAPSPDVARPVKNRERLEQLRVALLQFAATHQGRFPSREEMSLIASELWEVPDAGGVRFHYRPGRLADQTQEVMAYEPEFDPARRLVLKSSGDIVEMSSADLDALFEPGTPP